MRAALAVLFLLSVVWPAQAAVPSFRELQLDPAELAPLIGESQMIIIRPPRVHAWTRDGEDFKKKAIFVTSLKVVNAPEEKVRAVVRGVKDYPQFLNEVEEIEVSGEKDSERIAFETELNLMVMSVGVDYTLAYKDEPNGDITWRLVEGDLGEHTGRWEFFALPGGKTLLANTSWQDYESIGITVRTILKAQPDMKHVVPVATAAVIMNGVSRRAEGLPKDETAPAAAAFTEPVPPTLTGGANLPLPALRKLAETGTLMLIHPKQWFKGKNGKPRDFSFMSAAAIVNLPAERSRALTLSLERFPEFLDQVDSIKRAPDTDGKRAYDFKLKVGISIFTIAVKYRLVYTDLTPLAVTYRRHSGDIETIHGAWEFFDLGDGKSLVLYTTGNKMGDDAPGLLKLGKNMPNRDLIVGTSSTALTIMKLVPWLAKQ